MQNFDYVVIGSGIVGLSMTLSLLKQNNNVDKKITLITDKLPTKLNKDEYDLRVSSLNQYSIEYLQKLDIWQKILDSNKAQIYKKLTLYKEYNNTKHNLIDFTAEQLNKPQLGVMLENNLLTDILLNECKKFSNFSIYQGQIKAEYKINKYYYGTCNKILTEWTINIDNSSSTYKLKTNFIFACDGSNSKFRSLANIPIYSRNYPTSCMLILVNKSGLDKQQTWQHIRNNSPKAWLPLTNSYGILCLYDTNYKINKYQRYNNQQLRSILKVEFPELSENTEIIKFSSFPLKYQTALKYYNNGVFLVGDSAHVISPMAGQGVNIGLLDVMSLSGIIENNLNIYAINNLKHKIKSKTKYFSKPEEINNNIDALTNSLSIEEIANLYTNDRYFDNKIMLNTMDFIHKFSIAKDNYIFNNLITKISYISDNDIIKQYIANYYIGNRNYIKYLEPINFLKKIFR